MSRTAILLLGLLALALLIFLCIRKHTPFIQEDILTRTSSVLAPVPTDWAKVAVDGRNVILTGVAPTQALKDKAGEMAKAVPGVVSVDNQISLANEISELNTDEPEPMPTPVPEVASPFKSLFAKTGQGIVLSGNVPDEEQRNTLVRLAKQKFGDANVTDNLTIASGAPVGWLDAAKVAVNNLAYFHDGTANLTDTQIDMTGHVLDAAAKTTIEGNLQKNLPGNFKSEFDLTVPKLAVEQIHPEPRMEKVSVNCADLFKKKLASLSIHFSTDSDDVMGTSRTVLNKVMEFTNQCPDTLIQVAGYTDSRGSSAYNMNLSKQRAQEVVNKLINKGLSASRLQAIGFGETRPLSENTTSSGQAKNRRVEFKYLQEKGE